MRRLIACFILLSSMFCATAAYSYKRSITIDYTKVGTSTHSDFTVLVSGTYSYLATTANGGRLANASGYDVDFFSDSALTTPLSWERERHILTTGEVVFWVKVSSVSHTANTVIYMAMGDSGVTTDQSDGSGAWESNTKVVYHFPDGTALSTEDSTDSGYTLNNGSSQVTAVDGKIGGAASFPDTTTQTLNSVAASTRVTVNGGLATISFWGYISDPSTGGKTPNLVRNAYTGNLFYGVDWNKNYNTEANRKIRFTSVRANATSIVTSATKFPLNTWTHFVFTYDGTNVKIYQSGVETDSAAFSSTTAWPASASAGTLVLGQGANTATNAFKGRMDEFRVVATNRDASWVLAEYNNQNSPSTFYAVGDETAAGASQSRPFLIIVTDQ